jgi:hypothetical protein
MRARNFRLSRTGSVLMPPVLGQGVARGVIAGEACTEVGCDSSRASGASWLERWFGINRKSNRAHERKGHATRP